jgi:hypothetical protein
VVDRSRGVWGGSSNSSRGRGSYACGWCVASRAGSSRTGCCSRRP